MLFESQDHVPDSFDPPGNISLPNWAHTRYVPWSSWASASTILPNAGSGSSTQGESSGLRTYAHELTHLLRHRRQLQQPVRYTASQSRHRSLVDDVTW